MIGISGGRRIFLAAEPIDFRKGMDSIAALVAEALKADPFCGDMFIFRPKRCDRLKILVWDGSGLILATKRLEEGRFCWPPARNGTSWLSSSAPCSGSVPRSSIPISCSSSSIWPRRRPQRRGLVKAATPPRQFAKSRANPPNAIAASCPGICRASRYASIPRPRLAPVAAGRSMSLARP